MNSSTWTAFGIGMALIFLALTIFVASLVPHLPSRLKAAASRLSATLTALRADLVARWRGGGFEHQGVDERGLDGYVAPESTALPQTPGEWLREAAAADAAYWAELDRRLAAVEAKADDILRQLDPRMALRYAGFDESTGEYPQLKQLVTAGA